MGVTDIGFDRFIEQNHVLRDEPQSLAQALLGQVTHIFAINQNAPTQHIVKAEQQLQKRRLPRARRPDKRDFLTRRQIEIDILDTDRTRIMREPDAFKHNRARWLGELNRIWLIGNLWLHAEEPVKLLQVHRALLDLAPSPTENVERRVKGHEHCHHAHHIADQHRPLRDIPGRDSERREQAHIHRQCLRRIEHIHRADRIDITLIIIAHCFVKAPGFAMLSRE